KELNALQTVGYKELFDYFDDKISLNEAVERIRISTRQYAKRQFTWFRKDKEISWMTTPSETDKSFIKNIADKIPSYKFKSQN
ncbi:MAG: hypothetical protein ABI480_16065, partial [Chitinophagaceae bacterium]